jgi:hypothetical protein
VKKALQKNKQNPLPETANKNVVNLAGYITNHINHIDYLGYKNQSYYVGSGMIESGNKSLPSLEKPNSGAHKERIRPHFIEGRYVSWGAAYPICL